MPTTPYQQAAAERALAAATAQLRFQIDRLQAVTATLADAARALAALQVLPPVQLTETQILACQGDREGEGA